MKTSKIFNFNIVKDSHLNEMAYIRSVFKDRVVGFTWQIVENWILIRYCSIIGSTRLKKHWQDELYQKFLRPLNEDKIKKTSNQSSVKYTIINQYWFIDQDLDDSPETILNAIEPKISKENIEINDNIRQAIADLCNFGLKDMVYLISYSNAKDIQEYANTSVEVFSGDEVEIEAECHYYILEDVIEKFGENVTVRPIDKEHFSMKLKANPIGFRLWAMRNIDLVDVKKPESLVNKLREIIKDADKRYNK